MNHRIFDLAEAPAAPAPARSPAVLDDAPLFETITMAGRPAAWSLVSSVAVHALAIFLTIAVTKYLPWLQEDDIDWSHYSVEPLRLHLAEPIYFTSTSPAKEPKAAPRPPAAKAATAANPSRGTGARRAFVPPQLELPTLHEIAKDAPVILQPEFRPQNTPPPPLPPLAFWAKQAPDLPKPPPRREVVVPGRTEAPAPPKQMAAPPVTAVPNREQVAADVNVSLPPAPVTPALPVPNSTTTPIRLRNAQGAEAASFERFSGQPANVLALAADRPDARYVEIPKGLRNVPPAAAPGTGGATGGAEETPGPAAGARANTASENAQGADAAGGSRTPNTSGRATQTAPGSAATSGTAGAPRASANAAEHAGTVPPTSGNNVVVRPIAPPEVTRITHPSSGNFDVVIMQSGARDDLPNVSGLLTGNPVYTVYLRVGDQKEWLLEYCVPARDSAQPSPYQVNIEDSGTITPPYPIATAIPNTLMAQQIPKHIVLHGFLTANGSLRNVKAPENSTFMTQLLAVLSEWQFRPALKNKQPVDVEILLVIPPRA